VKIVFVYPAITDSGFNVEGKPILFNQIHHGLCYLSAVCKKEGFSDIELIDLRMLDGWKAFEDAVRAKRPDVVGVTMMSPDYPYATKCLEIVKGIDKGIKTIVGGLHPTIMTEEVGLDANIDFIVVGEGELVFPKLLKQLDRGELPDRIIKGIRPDVNELPFIDRELFRCLEMPYDFFLPLPFVTILAGRGCGYNCRFCSPAGKIMHGHRIRRRSVENVIEELHYLRDTYGVKSIQFWDDCFTEDKRWVMEFCDRYKGEGFKLPFVCQTRADIICRNPDMMKKLKKTGLKMASIGFESGNDRVLKFMNKGTTVKKNLEAAKICKRLGIKIWAYHMFGVPTEKPDEVWDTVNMIKKIGPYRSSAAFFAPHPGSYLYDYCKEHGLSLIDAHGSFVRFPDVDEPKIKGIDYRLLKKAAAVSKNVSFKVKARIRLERIIWHKRNKPFKRIFSDVLRGYSSAGNMTILRITHKAGRL